MRFLLQTWIINWTWIHHYPLYINSILASQFVTLFDRPLNCSNLPTQKHTNLVILERHLYEHYSSIYYIGLQSTQTKDKTQISWSILFKVGNSNTFWGKLDLPACLLRLCSVHCLWVCLFILLNLLVWMSSHFEVCLLPKFSFMECPLTLMFAYSLSFPLWSFLLLWGLPTP